MRFLWLGARIRRSGLGRLRSQHIDDDAPRIGGVLGASERIIHNKVSMIRTGLPPKDRLSLVRTGDGDTKKQA